MIYRIEISQITSKGKKIKQLDRFVSFEGNIDELRSIMKESYIGFGIHVHIIEKIETIDATEKEDKSTKLTRESNFAHILKHDCYIEFEKYLSKEMVEDFRERCTELEKKEEELKKIVIDELSKRFEVRDVRFYGRLSPNLTQKCSVTFNGDIWLERNNEQKT